MHLLTELYLDQLQEDQLNEIGIMGGLALAFGGLLVVGFIQNGIEVKRAKMIFSEVRPQFEKLLQEETKPVVDKLMPIGKEGYRKMMNNKYKELRDGLKKVDQDPKRLLDRKSYEEALVGVLKHFILSVGRIKKIEQIKQYKGGTYDSRFFLEDPLNFYIGNDRLLATGIYDKPEFSWEDPGDPDPVTRPEYIALEKIIVEYMDIIENMNRKATPHVAGVRKKVSDLVIKIVEERSKK